MHLSEDITKKLQSIDGSVAAANGNEENSKEIGEKERTEDVNGGDERNGAAEGGEAADDDNNADEPEVEDVDPMLSKIKVEDDESDGEIGRLCGRI